jgi:hypothetical protein
VFRLLSIDCAKAGEVVPATASVTAPATTRLRETSFVGAGPAELDLTAFGAVIFASGFRPDFRSWMPWPDAFDDDGFPIQVDGASTVIPGLYFVGVHFLRKRKSSLFIGVGEDASIIARDIARRKHPSNFA